MLAIAGIINARKFSHAARRFLKSRSTDSTNLDSFNPARFAALVTKANVERCIDQAPVNRVRFFGFFILYLLHLDARRGKRLSRMRGIRP